jgi:excisionase family DNA binding protein
MSTSPTKTTVTLDDLRNGPPTISIDAAARYLGIGRSHAYLMARKGLLPTIKLGSKRVRVPSAALLRMLDGSAPVTAVPQAAP